jgi:hypothetical protein
MASTSPLRSGLGSESDVGGADVEGFGGRSRTPSPRVSLDREPDAGAAPDVKLPSSRDEVWVSRLTLRLSNQMLLRSRAACARIGHPVSSDLGSVVVDGW